MTNEPTSSTERENTSTVRSAVFASSSYATPEPAAFATGGFSVSDWTPREVGASIVIEAKDPGPDDEEVARLAQESLITETIATTRAQMEVENTASMETLTRELQTPMLVAAERLSDARFELTQRIHLDTVALAIQLAEKILHRSIELNRELVQENLERALAAAGTLESVVIRMHPDDHGIIAETAPALTEAIADRPVEVHLEPDETLHPGDCVLRFEDGGVDARFSTQLAGLGSSVRDLILNRPRDSEQTS
jgi:flagellar biosynthesis/type III secretory pathway protein FliH